MSELLDALSPVFTVIGVIIKILGSMSLVTICICIGIMIKGTIKRRARRIAQKRRMRVVIIYKPRHAAPANLKVAEKETEAMLKDAVSDDSDVVSQAKGILADESA